MYFGYVYMCVLLYVHAGAKYKCLLWFTPLAVLCFLTLSVIALVALSVTYMLKHSKQSHVIEVNGDTVYLDQVESRLYSSWTVTECLENDDFEHVTTLHRVKGNDVVIHEKNKTFESGRFRTSGLSRDTGIVENLYLLEGSWINYTMCLDSSSTYVLNGKLFIFDRNKDLQNFLSGASDGTDTAVYQRHLPVGLNNQTICTSILFVVSRVSYYHITAEIPSDVLYMFNYTYSQLYLNGSDYASLCDVWLTHDCSVSIPSSVSSTEKYTLLGSVEHIPPTIAVSPTTHICVTAHNSFFLPGVMSAVAGALLLLLVIPSLVLCVQLASCVLCKRRQQLRIPTVN